MNGNSLVVGMAFILALLSLAVALFVYQYVQLTRSLNASQFAISQVEFRQNRLRALINEAVEYSQRNPSINPLLYTVGAKPSPNAPSKPSGR